MRPSDWRDSLMDIGIIGPRMLRVAFRDRVSAVGQALRRIAMRRLESVRAALQGRSGVDPFAQRPLVIEESAPRTSFREITIEGTSVAVRWGEFQGAEVVGGIQEKVTTFPDRERAEAKVAEWVTALSANGFEEVHLRASPQRAAGHAGRRGRAGRRGAEPRQRPARTGGNGAG